MRPANRPPNKPTETAPIAASSPRPKWGIIPGILFLLIAGALLFRLASGSGMLPGQNNAPMDQFDYLMRRGLNDAFHFVGTLIKEGPDGAYEQTTRAFQQEVSPETFAAYMEKYPAIRQIIREENRVPAGAVTVEEGDASLTPPRPVRWEGNLPTDDEVYRTIYLEMHWEEGMAKVNRIRIKRDTLPPANPPQ